MVWDFEPVEKYPIIFGTFLVVFFSALLTGLIYLFGLDILYIEEGLVFIVVVILSGFILIGTGISKWSRRIRGKKDELVQGIQGGEFGLFGDTRYYILCTECKRKNFIMAPERPVDQKCIHCGSDIITRRRENRTIQEGWPTQFHLCPQCKDKILLSNSIHPLLIVCANCKAKIEIADEEHRKKGAGERNIECPKCEEDIHLNDLSDSIKTVCPNCNSKIRIEDVDQPRKRVRAGSINCPKCSSEVDLSLRIDDRLKCPYCRAKMRFKD
jgi:DNA-directed RNA polymerase subunit RPC12/RpoP